ncbi:MAG: GNAT family N-acetyltransferase [Dehalococcoidia bacterium]
MNVEYRLLTPDDYEQASYLESRAFYNQSSPERVEQLRKFFPPEWTVGAFLDGLLVADVRTIPQVRGMRGSRTPFGAVGPVACLAPYRRRGYVGKLLKMALELMHERGQVLSGLHTPHDALYRRYGWERGEGKKKYLFAPKQATLRFQSAPGTLSSVKNEDWQRLDALFRAGTSDRNGPFARVEVWWREVVLREYGRTGAPTDSDATVWTDENGVDQGYVVYFERPTGVREGNWEQQEIFVRDLIALTPDAYLGLWQHLLTHDLAAAIVCETRPDDPLPDLLEDPFVVKQSISEGAMLRIVDVERALAKRPFRGAKSAAVTIRIEDPTLPHNDGVWRIEGSGTEMRAERTDASPQVEMSINMLAPLYSGHLSPSVASGVGMIKIRDGSALDALGSLFAVDDLPYSPDWY